MMEIDGDVGREGKLRREFFSEWQEVFVKVSQRRKLSIKFYNLIYWKKLKTFHHLLKINRNLLYNKEIPSTPQHLKCSE
jgi:hypothetical protein